MTREENHQMKLKDIPDRAFFKMKKSCGLTLQVSHHLGGNRVVVKLPNTPVRDATDFEILNGDTEVYFCRLETPEDKIEYRNNCNAR